MHKEIGLDLGSMNMLVSTAEEGIIAQEPACVSVTREGNHLHSVGRLAEADVADSPSTYRLARPLRGSLVTDVEATRTMMSHMIHGTCGSLIIKPRVVIGIPFDLSEEEESLIDWIAARSGARETFLVYSPVAALAGMELPRDAAALVVDIGASQTSLMLVAGAKILYKNTIHVGGDSFDAAIAAYIAKQHKMKINTRSAEQVKIKIGTLWTNREDKRLDVRGKSLEDGSAVTVRISSHEMFDAFEQPTADLLAAVCEAISKIPSPYVGEVFRRGILLCGGGSQLDGLDKMISGVTGVNARVVQDPDLVVARGLGRILADLPTSMKNEKINISLRCMRPGV